MNDTINQEIKFLQHNCARSTNTMISCLEYDLKKKIDIVCMQESWIDLNQIIISHSAFNRILLEQEENETHKQRIMTFVSKKFKFSVTSRSNLCSNTDIESFNISKTNIKDFTMFNVYNEKKRNRAQTNTQLNENWKRSIWRKTQSFAMISTLIINDEILESRRQFEQMH
jgi:hypothetical protein